MSGVTAGEGLVVEPLAGYTGAAIHGVDLRGEIDDDVIAAVRAALHRWKVVFFRGQHLDHDQHIAFARRFGTVRPEAGDGPEGHPEIQPVDSRRNEEYLGDLAWVERYFENGWHTDGTWLPDPPSGTILRADIVPSHGGDTTWTNLVAAYEGLPAPLQRLAEELRARHAFPDVGGTWGARPRFSAWHPVVRVHPETGEKALYVSPNFTFWLNEVEGLSPTHSRRLLDLFYEQSTRPEYTVRFRWRPGDVAFWDNHVTAHLGPTDLLQLGFERVLYRVTIAGPVVVGADGRPSEAAAPGPP